jgi:hypothetical protein
MQDRCHFPFFPAAMDAESFIPESRLTGGSLLSPPAQTLLVSLPSLDLAVIVKGFSQSKTTTKGHTTKTT